MSYGAIGGCIVLLLIISILILLYIDNILGKSVVQTDNECEEAEKRPYKVAPGKRYEHYDHSSEPAHRTAEQRNWRSQNILSAFTILFAGVAAVFAVKTYYEAKRQSCEARRQADAADDTLAETDKPAFILEFREVDIFGKNHAGRAFVSFTVQNASSKAGYLDSFIAQTVLRKSLTGTPPGFANACSINSARVIYYPMQVGSVTATCTGEHISPWERSQIENGEVAVFFMTNMEYGSLSGYKWMKTTAYEWKNSINGEHKEGFFAEPFSEIDNRFFKGARVSSCP